MNKTLEQRFLEKVKKSDGCWEWTAFRNPKGYGMFKVGGRHVGAHRISYELFVGEIPNGLLCLHRCDNPSCVNPKHLFVGTNQDNMDDMKSKGRGHVGERCWRAKANWSIVHGMREQFKRGARMVDLAHLYSLSPSCVEKIVHNRTWVVNA